MRIWKILQMAIEIVDVPLVPNDKRAFVRMLAFETEGAKAAYAVSLGDLDDRIEVAVAAGGAGFYVDWADLNSVAAIKKDTGIIINSSASHTDPFTSTSVPDRGIYRYDVVGATSGWRRVGDLSLLSSAASDEATDICLNTKEEVLDILAAIQILDAQVAANAATAASNATASTTAKIGAETARDESTIARSIYGTEALGRAAVADNAYFICYGSLAQNAIEYRQRTNSTTSVVIRAYPSLSAMLDTWSRLSIFRNTAYVSASTEWALLPEMFINHSGFSGTGSISGTTLTITGTPTGKLAVGSTIVGGTISSNTYITALGTGTGGAGTYTVNNSQTVTSTTITAGCPKLFMQWFVRDSSGTRLIYKIALMDGTVVLGVASGASNINPATYGDAKGGTGKVVMPLVVTTAGTTAGFLSGGTTTIDFGTGGVFGTSSAKNFADTELLIEKITGYPGVASQIANAIPNDQSVKYNSLQRILANMPTTSTSTVGKGVLNCSRIFIDPIYDITGLNICLYECGKDSLQRFRGIISTYNGSTHTILASTGTIDTTGLTGFKTYNLIAQTGNSMGIPVNTIIGEIEIDLKDGGTFGLYANQISWAEGALINSRIQPTQKQSAAVAKIAGSGKRVSTALSTVSILKVPAPETATHGVDAIAAFHDLRGLTIFPQFTLPTDLYISKLGKRGSDNLFQFELSSVTNGVVAYGGTTSGTNIPTAGLNGYQQFNVFAFGTTTIAPIGTLIGTIAFDIPADGTGSGLYNTAINYSQGAIINSKVQSSTTIIDTKVSDALRTYKTSPFLNTVTDSYMRDIVEDICIDFGVAGRTYILNYRSDTAGSTRRLQFYLYDPVRGINIATWGRQETYDWSSEVPESVYLSGATLGSVRTDVQYVGTGCTIFIKPGSIKFDKGASTYTTIVAGGIDPSRVKSVEQTKEMIKTGKGIRNKNKTFGPGGDYPTLKEAVDSLFGTAVLSAALGNPNNVQRAWWPFSDICTPAHQWTLQAMPGHTEIKTPALPAGVGYARGVLCWMGMTIRLLNDTELKAQTTSGVETYFFDFNLGGRIIAEPGTLIWTDGATTSTVHQDAGNGISVPSVANASDPTAGLLFFHITGYLENGIYRANHVPWGCGTSDGQDIHFKGTIFHVSGTEAKGGLTSHTSPNNKFPGSYTFEDTTFIGGTRGVGFITSNTIVARHKIYVKNSDMLIVAAGPTTSAFVRVGKQPGVTYDAGLEPL